MSREKPAKAEERWVRGRFTARWEVSSFEPDDSDERWWVSWAKPNEKVTKRLRERAAAGIRVRLCGVVSDPGAFGHMGAYEREFVVGRIGEVEPTALSKEERK